SYTFCQSVHHGVNAHQRRGPVDLIEVHTFEADAPQAVLECTREGALSKPPWKRQELGCDQHGLFDLFEELTEQLFRTTIPVNFCGIYKTDSLAQRGQEGLLYFFVAVAMTILPDDTVAPLPGTQAH